MPRTGESLVRKFAMIIFVLSVLTPGLCVTLTSSKLQSPVNLEKFHIVMLESTDAEIKTLLQIKKLNASWSGTDEFYLFLKHSASSSEYPPKI